MNTYRNILFTLLTAVGLLISGCGLLSGGSTGSQNSSTSGVSNGEQIYFTGANAQGERILYTGGPNFGGMMMGSYLTCAACHGPDAHGGEHFMHMQVIDATPIYYEALNTMEAEESGQTPTPNSYSLEEFRSAVVEGQHPDGDQLSQDMPRWQLSDADLDDLFAFLKTIPQ